MKILILSDGELLGDGLLKLPFLKAIKKNYPKSHLTWQTTVFKTVYASLLKEISSSLIDDIIEISPLTWCKKLDYDLIIETKGCATSALKLRLNSKAIVISCAYNWLFSSKKPLDLKKKELLVDQLMDLCEAATSKKTTKDLSLDVPLLYQIRAKEILPLDDNYIGIAPGAGGKFKCWPLDKFISLSKQLEQKGKTCVFFLGPDECEWKDTIKAKLKTAVFPLQEENSYNPYLTMALSKRCDVLVSNDAGLAHLMAPSNQALVVLFGPTNEKKFVPNSNNCHILTAKTYHSNQTKDIPVEAVYEKICSLKGNK